MDELLARLPRKLQLDWCLRGFEGVPWFPQGPAGPDTRSIRIVGEAPLESVEAVDPVALAMLAAWLLERGNQGARTTLDDSAKSVHAFRAGLLSVLAGKLTTDARVTRTAGGNVLLSPTHVGTTLQIEPFLAQIGAMFQIDKETATALKYCFAELLRNVFEHSGSAHGGVLAAGHYGRDDEQRITIALADLGIGVPSHFRQKHGSLRDDESALRAALEPLATGSFDLARNAGLGLYMTRRLADMVGGKFWLLTGDLCARHDGDESPGGRALIEISRALNPWRGTVVALTLRPGAITSFDRTIRLANEELRGGGFEARIQFSRKVSREGWETVEVPADVGNMAQDKLAAERIRRSLILPALREGKRLVLSFHGVALTTQSFLHALLAEPLRELGPEASPTRLLYARCSDQVREVIRLVVGYVLEGTAERGGDPDG
ncbi:MAG: DUF4325 domain-containing protein [Polyangiales bacterium]